MLAPSAAGSAVILAAACLVAPLPALLISRRRYERVLGERRQAREEAEETKLRLENVRYRTARLREELSAANQQARLSQLTRTAAALQAKFGATDSRTVAAPAAVTAQSATVSRTHPIKCAL